MSAPSDGARGDARKARAESRCWALVAGNPCEGRAGHEGAHTALSMAGAWLYATAAPHADEVDDATSLGLLIFEDAQVGGTRKIVERILASDWLAGVIADAKAEAWDERDRARATYPDPHPEDCAGWEDCWCASYPNPYRVAKS